MIRLREVQRQLPLPAAGVTTVLATVGEARSRLPGYDEDDITDLCECGDLLAWNIGLVDGIREDRPIAREIRIWPESIERLRGAAAAPRNAPDAHTAAALALLMQADGKGGATPGFITGRRLSLLWNCSASHVINFCAAKMWTVHGSKWERGPKGSPMILTNSVLTWMEARAL